MNNNEINQVCINMINLSREYVENDIYNQEILKDTLRYLIKYVHKFSNNQCYYMASSFNYMLNVFENNNVVITKLLKVMDVLNNKVMNLNSLKMKLNESMKKKIKKHFNQLCNFTGNEDVKFPNLLENYISQIDIENINLDKNILKMMHLFIEIREIRRKIYYYYYLYVNDLNIKMQYIKIEIFKLEFSNQFEYEKSKITNKGEKTTGYIKKDSYSGTVCDQITNWYLDSYIELSNEFKKYNQLMNKLDIDEEYINYNNSNWLMGIDSCYHKLIKNF